MFSPLLVCAGSRSTSAPYAMLRFPGLRSAEVGLCRATCGQSLASHLPGKARAEPDPCATGRTPPPCAATTVSVCPRPDSSMIEPDRRPLNPYFAIVTADSPAAAAEALAEALAGARTVGAGVRRAAATIRVRCQQDRMPE